jgi:hypothetical protein
MAEPKRKHLYDSQQKPLDDLPDAEHAPVVQEMFSRKPPSTEDDYFYERELRRREGSHPIERGVGRAPREKRPPADEPGSIWQRIYRAFSRWVDVNWRP